MSIYNVRAIGPDYRMVKWDDDLNVEAIYKLSSGYAGRFNCDCFAGNRNTCRHREMLAQFIATGRVNSWYYLDYDNWRWALPFGVENASSIKSADR